MKESNSRPFSQRLLTLIALIATMAVTASAGRVSKLLTPIKTEQDMTSIIKDETNMFGSEKNGNHAIYGRVKNNHFMKLRSVTDSQNKKLKQESSYEGYERLAEPFTETDKYNYFDAFFMGLQLSDFYDYSDECLNSWVFMIDDFAYLSNNRTLVPQDAEENWFHTYLNITGLVAGSMSDILPECYQFYKSVVEREEERWARFDRSWGNFFLAFLFN